MIVTQFNEDLILATASGSGMVGILISESMKDLPLEQLRYNGSQIINAATVTSWHIDPSGQKRLEPSADRQPLTCAFDDELINEAEVWRIKTDSDDLRDYLADKRWRIETGGILINAINVPTDDRSKVLIEGAADYLAPDEITKFNNYTITGADMVVFRDAMRAHVQACFKKYDQLSAQIDNGEITSALQIDSEDWPSNT